MEVDLKAIARRIRRITFETIHKAGGGHFGGTMSLSEIMAVLYFSEMRVDPQNPEWEGRDRLVLSKGHGGPALYVTLAAKGFFPKEYLAELDKAGGRIPKHVDRLKLPHCGIDVSSGALGIGLSVGAGMALAAKQGGSPVRVYVIMGDGECNEGMVWEAAMFAAKYKLDNLVAIVDRNNCQIDGTCDCVMPLEPFAAKWEAFGWRAHEVDGHDTDALREALSAARATAGRPTILIARTRKGCGVSFMENNYLWHSGSITPEQAEQALAELEGAAC